MIFFFLFKGRKSFSGCVVAMEDLWFLPYFLFPESVYIPLFIFIPRHAHSSHSEHQTPSNRIGDYMPLWL